jgi:pimeloyl-ACP methyl ester carboxylesterase
MIHGALASRRYLVPTAVLLAQSMHVYVPEMPGHGSSSKPKNALTVQQQAAVLAEWFHVKSLKHIHIFANSYGCQVAAQLVADHPEMVAGLILSDPTTDPKARSLIQELWRLYLDGAFEPKGAKSQFFADLYDMGPIIAYETGKRMIADNLLAKLSRIKCRTLIVRGEKDPIAPQEWSKEVAKHIAHAEFKVIPNAPHCINYATPIPLTKIILEFISGPKVI